MRPQHAPRPLAGREAETPVRIGEAARRIGVSPSALRLWERQQLVQPARSGAGYRLYSEEDIRRLRQIRQMRGQHVNAPGIRRLIQAPAAPASRPRGGRRHALDGARVRNLRLERGMSLREASGRTGLSVSFLSAIERGAAGASLATLQRLVSTYGVTMLELFEPVPGAGRRVRPGERPILTLKSAGVRIEQLAHGTSALEPQLFVLAPRSSSDGEYAHAGEEFVFVLSGEVTFWVGEGERYRLRAGDALTFPSTLLHRWRNRAAGETRLLWINTPPTF